VTTGSPRDGTSRNISQHQSTQRNIGCAIFGMNFTQLPKRAYSPSTMALPQATALQIGLLHALVLAQI
jgi:hypothetical protein